MQRDGVGAKGLQRCQTATTECGIQLAVAVETSQEVRGGSRPLPGHYNLAIGLQGQEVAIERQTGDASGAKCGVKTAIGVENGPPAPLEEPR